MNTGSAALVTALALSIPALQAHLAGNLGFTDTLVRCGAVYAFAWLAWRGVGRLVDGYRVGTGVAGQHDAVSPGDAHSDGDRSVPVPRRRRDDSSEAA